MAQHTTLVEMALSRLRQAVLNYRLYPTSSEVVIEGIESVFQGFRQALIERPEFTLTDLEGRLFIDAETPLAKSDFREFMRQHDIQSIQFKRGLEMPEIWTLVEGLAAKREALQDQGGLSGFLAAHKAAHLEAQECQFVAVRKGEDVKRQIRLMYAQIPEDYAGLERTMTRTWKLWQETQDAEDRETLEIQAVHQISQLPAALLRHFLTAHSPVAGEPSDFRMRVLHNLAGEKIIDLLKHIPAWIEEVLRTHGEPTQRSQYLGFIGAFVARLRSTPAGAALEEGPFKEAQDTIQDSLHDPANMERGSFIAFIEKLAQSAPADLLADRWNPRWKDYVSVLASDKQEDLLRRLMLRVAENFAAADAVTRERAALVLRAFEMWVAPHRLGPTLQELTRITQDHLEQERDAKTYAASAQNLQMAAMDWLLYWNHAECARLLGVFRRHTLEETKLPPRLRELAEQSLGIFARRAFEILMKDLFSGDGNRQAGATQVLTMLGGESTGPLLSLLQSTDDPRLRQFAVQHLRRFMAQAREVLAAQLSPSMPPEPLMRLLPFCSQIIDASFIPALQALLGHPSEKVRAEVAHLLSIMNDPEAGRLVLDLLNDRDLTVQIQAIRLLRKLRVPGASAALASRLLEAAAPVQEEICVTLGQLRDPASIPPLIEVLDLGSLFRGRQLQTPDRVRSQAAVALGQFLPEPQAEKALNKALKDSNPIVQSSARAALGARR